MISGYQSSAPVRGSSVIVVGGTVGVKVEGGGSVVGVNEDVTGTPTVVVVISWTEVVVIAGFVVVVEVG